MEMSHWSFVLTAWSVVIASIVVYAAVMFRRGRRLSALVPPSRRRWADTEDPTGG